MALRTLNFTRRRRLTHQDIQITIADNNGYSSFDATLMLDRYRLPEDADVFLEAYRQTQWMRFYFGTIGNVIPPEDRNLTDFDTSEGILFRVRVVASTGKHGLLIAEADKIRPRKIEGEEARGTGLLNISRSHDLGEEVFRLEYDDPQVLLKINASLNNCLALVEKHVFISLVIPAILRDILNRILYVEKHTDTEDREDWRSCWLQFATLLPNMTEPPARDEEDQFDDWIDSAVTSFCRLHQMKSMFDRSYWKGGAE
ncbi:MAG: hypothetical protein AB1442_17765 [Nitrospirota bacterium]